MSVTGLGPLRTTRLLKQFGSADSVLGATETELSKIRGISSTLVSGIRKAANSSSLRDSLDRAFSSGAQVISLLDPGYPRLLQFIYAPPALFWAHGKVAVSGLNPVSVVGTRRPSDYGRSMAYDLAYQLASAGCTIVSGLAYGIDTIAHEAALDAGGKTVAVLGSGIQHVYPSRNAGLAERISKSGLVVSEFNHDLPSRPGHFPRRNRIISGLSGSTVIVEAYEKGGSLITARLALDQDRDVFAVPGQIGNPAAEGVNQLIQRGEAQLFCSVQDILRDAESDSKVKIETISEDGFLLSRIPSIPTHIDEIGRETELPAHELLIRLLRLETSGAIRQLPGKYFVRAPANSAID